MKDIEKYKYVYLWNRSFYEEEIWRTGTGVEYYEGFCQTSPGKWQHFYGSTRLSDYDYLCPCCGESEDHWVDQGNGEGYYSCGGYKTVATEEVQERIAKFETICKGNDNYVVEYRE